MESEVNTELKLIYKPKNKYKLQEAVGLKNEKQRWLSYLDIMRESLYEKNVDFNSSYRTQKHVITSQIVRAFKKKAPDFPATAGDWAIKEMLITTIQNRRYYLKKKKDDLVNSSRIPLQNLSPESQDLSPRVIRESISPVRRNDIDGRDRNDVSKRGQESLSPLRPLEPRNDINEQGQNNGSKRKKVGGQHENQGDRDNVPKKRGRKPKSR